jgi:hypothetical protein
MGGRHEIGLPTWSGTPGRSRWTGGTARRDGDEPAFSSVKIPVSVTRRCEPPLLLLQQRLVCRPAGRQQDWGAGTNDVLAP